MATYVLLLLGSASPSSFFDFSFSHWSRRASDVSTRPLEQIPSKGVRSRNLVALDVIGARRVADGALAAVSDGCWVREVV